MIFRVIAIICASLTINCSTAFADQLDAAVRQQRLDEWEVSLKAFHERVTYVTFAYGCKIIKAEAQIGLLLAGLYNDFNRRAISMNQHGYNYGRFNPEYKSAGRAGFERSQIPGQCDYWTANQEEAVKLRAQSSGLMNYIGPAAAHPQMPYLFR